MWFCHIIKPGQGVEGWGGPTRTLDCEWTKHIYLSLVRKELLVIKKLSNIVSFRLRPPLFYQVVILIVQYGWPVPSSRNTTRALVLQCNAMMVLDVPETNDMSPTYSCSSLHNKTIDLPAPLRDRQNGLIRNLCPHGVHQDQHSLTLSTELSVISAISTISLGARITNQLSSKHIIKTSQTGQILSLKMKNVPNSLEIIWKSLRYCHLKIVSQQQIALLMIMRNLSKF